MKEQEVRLRELDFGDDWAITKVEADPKKLHVYLYLEYVSDTYKDSDTLERAILYDHTELREWRHLDILEYKSYVRCRIPRVKCKDGKTKQVALGWADKHDRHTFHFEMRVINLLQITKNQTKRAEFMNCSFRLVNWAHDSFMQGIREVNKVILMFLSHAKGVINALITNLNNAMAERLNGKIQELKLVGRGYRTLFTIKCFPGNTPRSLNLGMQITDSNAAFFDAANNFKGCIAGIHEVLRRQGLLEGLWTLNEDEVLSPGQKEEIDRVYKAYPHLNDDEFVAENLRRWLS